MNFEPFSPFDHSETLPPPVPAAAPGNAPSARYFDRVGCAWIVACVLLAGTAARMLPALAEPGGLRHALAALGLGPEPIAGGNPNSNPNPASTLASLPPHTTDPLQAPRGTSLKQETGPLVPAILSQF